MEDQGSVIRFSLDQVPERERRETLTEVFGRGVVNMEFEPLDDRPVFDFEIHCLPGVALTFGRSSPHRGTTGHERSLENDDLMLAWARRPARGSMLHRGAEVIGDGTGAFVSCSEPMVGETRSLFPFANVRVARHLLSPLLANPEDRLMRGVPASAEAFRLLKAYLNLLRAGRSAGSEVARASALHIADLVGLALGAHRDGAHLAASRGLRAARMASIKAWVLARLCDPVLSVTATAAAHGISPRYVQMLFEQEGTTFSCWLRFERLSLARRRLADSALSHCSIASIAFDCGFSDLSWFNHAYRRAFGETPSDTRHQAVASTRH